MRSRHQLGSLLRRNGVISEEQLNEALVYQQEQGMRLGEALLTLGFCEDAHLARALADQLGMPFVDLEETPPPRELLRIFPSSVARRLGAVPVEKKDGAMVVVARNPLDFSVDSTLRKELGMPVIIVSGVESQIQRVLDQWERLLMGAQTPPTVNHLPMISSRLGARSEVQDVKRFQEGATSAARVAETISDFLASGQSIELVYNHNSLRVMTTTPGNPECVAELPGDHFRLIITPPEHLS